MTKPTQKPYYDWDEAHELIETVPLGVSPILTTNNKIRYWLAKKPHYDPISDCNPTNTDDYAKGKTLEEAIYNVMNGKTEFILSECKTGYILNPGRERIE